MSTPVESLFARVAFTLPSGETTSWRVDCSALTDADLECVAHLAAGRVGHFGSVEAVVPGGERFAEALRRHATRGPLLLAADVLLSGETMERQRGDREAVGAVIFARGLPPAWVQPVFALGDVLDRAKEELDALKRRILYWQPAGEKDAASAIEDLGAARNNLLLEIEMALDKAALVETAAGLLKDWQLDNDRLNETALATRRWLAEYDSLGGHYGC